MAKKQKPLVYDGASKCFVDLRWSGGQVFATFTDGSQYSYPMSRAEAADWFNDESVGGYFNDLVR